MKKTYGPPRPVVNDAGKREDVIKRNLPALFEIRENDKIDYGSSLWDDLRTFESFGKSAVQTHDDLILHYSRQYNIDPDLVRAVMYAENARGHYGVLNKAGDLVGVSKSILPMNIQKNRWASLVDKKPEDMYDPDVNVEAGTVLLSLLRDQIEKPTPEKMGTLWNDMDNRNTNVFGSYVGKVYREKPWKKIE